MLIGHEYGHILHGDATFNLQLMVVLAGLQLLYDWSDSINNFGAGNQRSHQNSHHNYFDDASIDAIYCHKEPSIAMRVALKPKPPTLPPIVNG
ncbi:hypothetical protein JCM18903_1301 [Psychrobacter sp. JCM 18903]|uniref:M48 family metalloprotease n=1 Tax=Psychrobacter sp. JCM 18903 TaxID=1298610 RepID=UPI000430F522|nr:M48 family metalloprotease [Psychrobacter sp. JCM 18903]GAF61307.1 hypothetical protein JCM18903_1301 [Psychrobacter sp. JCM 18903]